MFPSLQEQFRERVEREKGTGYITSFVTGNRLPCIWTECDHPARREHMVPILEGEKPLFYFFCSERHLKMWLNSARSMGNLQAGDRGTLL